MFPKASVVDVSWAAPPPLAPALAWGLSRFAHRHLVTHWSRVYEYPWAVAHGEFRRGDWVLDAAGGDGPLQHHLAAAGCQVVNADHDPSRWPDPAPKGVAYVRADLRDLRPFADGAFDRVACVSVIEHIERPGQAIDELWRVLKPGGRLLLTLDVAHYARHNHTVDEQGAALLLSRFGALLPPCPADALTATFPEEADGRPGERSVRLRVLCLAVDKGVG